MATEAQEQHPPLIDIPTAAAHLGLSITAVRRKIREGEIPAYRMGGAQTVIRIDPLEIGDFVGHSSAYMVDGYRHLLDGQREQAAERLDAYLSAGLG